MPKPAALMLSAQQREQIRALAADLPALWQAPTTTHAQRKQLLRWLIKDVTLAKRGDLVVIAIRWQTEARTSLSIPRLKKSWELRQTQPEIMARIREWAPTHSDASIASLLNVNISTIAKWCEAGRVDSVQIAPHGPRWITLTPERIAELRKPTQQHWNRRRTGTPRQNVVE